jgi:hypothetical protein
MDNSTSKVEDNTLTPKQAYQMLEHLCIAILMKASKYDLVPNIAIIPRPNGPELHVGKALIVRLPLNTSWDIDHKYCYEVDSCLIRCRMFSPMFRKRVLGEVDYMLDFHHWERLPYIMKDKPKAWLNIMIKAGLLSPNLILKRFSKDQDDALATFTQRQTKARAQLSRRLSIQAKETTDVH